MSGWYSKKVTASLASSLVHSEGFTGPEKTWSYSWEEFRNGQCLFLWPLNELDDLNILLHELQGYSRPSMCFSTCSLMWPGFFEMWPQFVQQYPSTCFSIIDSILAIVAGSMIESSFGFSWYVIIAVPLNEFALFSNLNCATFQIFSLLL